MPRFRVNVVYEQAKDIDVWARDEVEASEKAQAVVEGWPNVISADAGDAEEIDG
jgi:hypothetical protein